MNCQNLFMSHIQAMNSRIAKIFDELSIDRLIIDAGSAQFYFEDDQEVPFRSNHHFRHWCPLEGFGHLLQLSAHQKPVLLAYIPDDFWHEHKPMTQSFWTDQFDIRIFGDEKELWNAVQTDGRVYYHGPNPERARNIGLETDLTHLLPRLNWFRSFKTEYEIACISMANSKAAVGHRAAHQAFLDGLSEFDIHQAYLAAIRERDHQLPYEGIVCLDEKGSFLHYSDKRKDFQNGKVLLIDSGANFHGYASDITRTYCTDQAPKSFQRLLDDAKEMQLALVRLIRPGISIADLHFESHIRISDLLLKHEIIRGFSKAEDVFEAGLSATFYPHGIGHMLGILVHDVAGRQINPQGDQGEADPRFPKLRSVRKMEPGMVLTVEPGMYFIDSLLKKRLNDEYRDHFNWQLIEELKPCGGMRIEDDVLVTENGYRNLTREYLDD